MSMSDPLPLILIVFVFMITPDDVTNLATISGAHFGFDEETPFVRTARKALPVWRRDAFTPRTDNDLAQLALIRSGAGIGICQVVLAKRDPQWVRVLTNRFAFSMETWLTMHEDLRHSPRCKITFDALLAGLQRHVT